MNNLTDGQHYAPLTEKQQVLVTLALTALNMFVFDVIHNCVFC